MYQNSFFFFSFFDDSLFSLSLNHHPTLCWVCVTYSSSEMFFYFPSKEKKIYKELEKRRIEMGDLFVRLLRTHVRIVKKNKKKTGNTQYYKSLYRSIHNQWNDTWNVHFMAQSKSRENTKEKEREPSPGYFICKYLSLNFKLKTERSSIHHEEK